MGTVIGPIDWPTWYCMRQCRESIHWCKQQKNPIYEVEIKGEQAILQTFMNQVLKRAA